MEAEEEGKAAPTLPPKSKSRAKRAKEEADAVIASQRNKRVSLSVQYSVLTVKDTHTHAHNF